MNGFNEHNGKEGDLFGLGANLVRQAWDQAVLAWKDPPKSWNAFAHGTADNLFALLSDVLTHFIKPRIQSALAHEDYLTAPSIILGYSLGMSFAFFVSTLGGRIKQAATLFSQAPHVPSLLLDRMTKVIKSQALQSSVAAMTKFNLVPKLLEKVPLTQRPPKAKINLEKLAKEGLERVTAINILGERGIPAQRTTIITHRRRGNVIGFSEGKLDALNIQPLKSRSFFTLIFNTGTAIKNQINPKLFKDILEGLETINKPNTPAPGLFIHTPYDNTLSEQQFFASLEAFLRVEAAKNPLGTAANFIRRGGAIYFYDLRTDSLWAARIFPDHLKVVR